MDYNYLEEKCMSLLLLTQGQELTLHQRGDAKQELDNLLTKLKGFKPLTEFPPIEDEETQFSKTVLVYDKDLTDFDLGFYDFTDKKWILLGNYQMNLVCWKAIETPMTEDVKEYITILTN